MKVTKIIFSQSILLGLILSSAELFGQTCTSISNIKTGPLDGWVNPANWDCGGGSNPPTGAWPGGSFVVIDADINIENDVIDLTSSSIVRVTIKSGSTLTFSSNGQLLLPSGAEIVFEDGAMVAVDNQGNGSLIEVGGNPVWGKDCEPACDNGTLTGPGTIDENSTPGDPLPINLLYFTGKVVHCSVDLSWATASEENFDYFSIERSADGIDFKEVAKVDGSGESMSRLDYNYTDEFPLEGVSYYRLRSMDFDGYTEVFETVIVQVEGLATDFNIYPNPIANGSFRVQTNFIAEEPVQLIVYNSLGTIEDVFVVDSWLTTHELEISKKGVYLFKIFTPGGTIIKRVLVN